MTRTDLEAYVGMLADFRAAVAGEVAAGRTLEQIKSGEAVAEIDARWDGKMFPTAQFREIVYRSLDGAVAPGAID